MLLICKKKSFVAQDSHDEIHNKHLWIMLIDCNIKL